MVGFIGLGKIGLPMAQPVPAGGFPLRVRDLDEQFFIATLEALERRAGTEVPRAGLPKDD